MYDDEKDFEEAILKGMRDRRLVGSCSKCNDTLTPEEYQAKKCNTCGPFKKSEIEPVYRITS